MDLYNPIPIHIGTNNATANFQPTSHIQMCTQQDIRSVATYEHVCYKKKTPTCVPQLFLKKELTATTRKRAIGPAQRYQPNGGQLAPGGGSNRFQCVSIGTG